MAVSSMTDGLSNLNLSSVFCETW